MSKRERVNRNKKERIRNKLIFVFIGLISIFHSSIILSEEINSKRARWHITRIPLEIDYYINQVGLPKQGSSVFPVIKSFNSWEEEIKEIIEFNYRELVNIEYNFFGVSEIDIRKGSFDYKNIITWITNHWPNFWHGKDIDGIDRAKPAVFITHVVWDSKAEDRVIIIESDVFLNGKNYSWRSNPPYSTETYNIENILCHEIGHLLGLRDILGVRMASCTMFGHSYPGETCKRQLKKQDIFLFRKLYEDHFLRQKKGP